jgi:tryptophan-rich sensory protein
LLRANKASDAQLCVGAVRRLVGLYRGPFNAGVWQLMTTALVAALVICGASALFEGLAAGRGVKQRFVELQLPRYSAPLATWIGIGALYYGICFAISYRLLSADVGFSLRGGAFALLLLLIGINIFWNVLFFRRDMVGTPRLAVERGRATSNLTVRRSGLRYREL